MRHPVAKLLIGFFVVAVLLVVAAVILTFSQPALPPAPLPQPNGYDDFVKAGEIITGDASGYGTVSEEELRAFVTKNAEALKLARTGLGRECRVTMDLSPTNTLRMSRLGDLKRLGQAMTAEGRLAEMENRPADAAEAYLAVIRFGCAIGEGGLIIDSLVSIAIDTIGTSRLEKLPRPSMPNSAAKLPRCSKPVRPGVSQRKPSGLGTGLGHVGPTVSRFRWPGCSYTTLLSRVSKEWPPR